MKNIYLLLFVSLISFLNNYSFSQESNTSGIKLVISTDKTNYLEGETVWEELILIVDKSVKLDYKPLLGPNMDLKESVFNSHKVPMSPLNISYHTFRKKEYPDTMYYFGTLDVGEYELAPKSSYLSILYLPADDYEFNAYINVSLNGEIYKVYAEPVKFTVQKPSGGDIIARQKYLDLIPLIPVDNPDYKLIVDKVNSFLQEYENSVYVDQVLRRTCLPYFHYLNKSAKEEIDMFYTIVLKYPGFASNYERLKTILALYAHNKDLDGFLKLTNDLEAKAKDNETLSKVLFHIKRLYIQNLKQSIFD